MSTDANCFPLPLAPFEHYLWLDDRPDHPMTFVIQATLSGQMDRGAFEAALEDARLRHPLLHSRIQRRPLRGLVWVPDQQLKPPLDWGELETPLRYRGRRQIDLRREPGLRVWVRCGDNQGVVTLQFHHCCCDGIGGFQFLGDLLACYGLRKPGDEAAPVLRPIDLSTLLSRGQLPRVELPVSAVRMVRDLVRETVRFAGRSIARLPLGPHAIPKRPELSPMSGIESVQVDEAVAERLRRFATANRATLNDVLLRDAFLTIRDWQSRYGSPRAGQWLRIAVPTNLRPARRQPIPAINELSYIFLTRRPAECRKPQALLDGIQQEMQIIKRWKLGSFFLAGVTWMRRIPAALPLWTSSRRCLSTLLLTNLGDVSRSFAARMPRRSGRIVVGNLCLESVAGAPPLRHNTRAALCIMHYDRTLTVNLYCDPRLFSSEAISTLMDLYMKRLCETAATRD